MRIFDPSRIAPAVEACLNGADVFSQAKTREVGGELRTDRDDFTEWRYLTGPYAVEQQFIAKLRGMNK